MRERRLMRKRIVSMMLLCMLAFTQVVAEYPGSMVWAETVETEVSVGELMGNEECYTSIQATEEGTAVTYIPGTWNTLTCEVTSHDVAKYNKVEITVVPACEGMRLGIMAGDAYLRNHWAEESVFESTDEQTLVYELGADVKSLIFYCDPPVSGDAAEAADPQSFVISSIRFLENDTQNEPADETGIVLDGDVSDWATIRKMAKDDGIFAQVASCRTKDYIYLMYELTDSSVFMTDQILFRINGETEGGYSNVGISYMLQSGTLLSYSGEDGAWGWTTAAGTVEKKLSSDQSVAEYKLPVSVFGENVESIDVNIGIINESWALAGQYPASNSSLETVPFYSDVYIESSSAEIENFAFTPKDFLKALSADTMQGGIVGSFSAEGGDGSNYTYSLANAAGYGADNDSFTISGNQLVVDTKSLLPGEYKVYVKVISDVREQKKEFTLTVGEAASDAVITEDIFSGAEGEWFAVDYNQANAAPNLTALKAASDGVYLYGYAAARELDNSVEFYIAADGSAGENLSSIWSDGTDVSHKIDAAGKIYAYENGEWKATGKTAQVYKESGGIEFQAAIADLADGADGFRVAVKEEDGMLPNRQQAMLEVTSPILSDAPAITADGDPSDWADLSPIAQGDGTIGDLYAFRNNEYLYVMTYVKDVDSSNSHGLSTNLYINSDADSATGYQHELYPAASGAEFLVQDWYSITVGDDVKNTEYFLKPDNSSAWTWTSLGSNMDYKACKETEESGIWCVEYAVPVSELKEVAGAISDDLYIALDRINIVDDLPEGSAPVSSTDTSAFVKAPKYQTRFALSLQDSSFEDWKTIPYAVENVSTDSQYNLYATRSQERLYTLVTSKNDDFTTDNTYYLDTDSSTGYTVDNYTGVDYVIRDAMLYPVTGDEQTGEAVCAVNMDYYSSSIKMQVYLEELGDPDEIRIAFVGQGYDGSTYDENTTPNKPLTIPADGSALAVTASFVMEREEGRYYPKESFESFSNPYTGWVSWANKWGDEEESAYDSNLVYVGVKWREFEPEEGVYDFEKLEELYHISDWVAEGKRINLRFIMDNPDTTAEDRCMDIPEWLYQKLVEENGEENAGTFYFRQDLPGGIAGSEGTGFSPNYNSELLQEYHDKAIKALAERYDDPSIVAYVQVGSLGHWGEIHTWPEGTGVFPGPTTVAKYMESYTRYFKNVKVGLRKPYPYAAANNFGLFNDVFGVSQWAGTASWLGWINNGCTDMGTEATAEDVAASKMPDWWKSNYSGGEFASGNVRLHLTDAGTIGCLQQVRDSHTTWLGPCSAAMITTDDEDAEDYRANILAMQKLMGYRFFLQSVTVSENARAGEDIALDMSWCNEGVAPFYYNWPLELSLLDADGNVAYSETKNVNLNEWLPGTTQKTVTVSIPKELASGTYTLAVAVVDPETENPAVNLALTGGRADLRYPLYAVSVAGTADPDEEKPGEDTKPGEDANPGDETKPVEEVKVTLNKTTATIKKGKTLKLTATVTPAQETVTWSSSNSKIAKVNKLTGTVTGVKAGTVSITAKTASGKTAVCKVTVKEIKSKKVSLNKKTATIYKGKTLKLKAAMSPKNTTDTLTWSSSNKRTATVDKNGKVTALKKGTTTITVKTSSGKKAVCKVTVKEIKSKKVALNKKSLSLKKGRTYTLKAALTPKNSTDTVTWKSSNKKVVSVTKNGKLKALKKGKATITVTTSSKKTAKCKVEVK